MKKKVIVVVCIALVAGIVFTVFERNRNKIMEVFGYKVATGDYTERISSTGVVEYESQIDVKTEVSGAVLKLEGQIGDRVSQGAVLAKLDDEKALLDYKDMLNQTSLAKARYKDYIEQYNEKVQLVEDQRLLQQKEIETLELDKKQLSLDMETTQELLNHGAAAQKEMDTLQEQKDELDLKLEVARTKLEQLRNPQLFEQELEAAIQASSESANKQKNILSKYMVVAPMEGIIVDKKLEAGSYAQVGDTLLTIASDKQKYAGVDIDEKYLGKLAIGKEAQIFVEAYPGESFKGEIIKINPEVNKETGTIRIKVKLLEKPELFLKNMTVTVEFVGEAFPKSIILPARYLVEGEDSVVYVEDKGSVTKRTIGIYNKNAKDIRVVSGLKEGEIVLDPDGLKEGTKVHVTVQGSDIK